MFIVKLNISLESPRFTATVNILYFQTKATAGLQCHGVWRPRSDLETHSGHWKETSVREPAQRCHLVSWWKYQEFVAHAHPLRYFLSLPACLFNRFPRHTLWKEALVSNVNSTADEWRQCFYWLWRNIMVVVLLRVWMLPKSNFCPKSGNSMAPLSCYRQVAVSTLIITYYHFLEHHFQFIPHNHNNSTPHSPYITKRH
jgi:hypothetical protein